MPGEEHTPLELVLYVDPGLLARADRFSQHVARALRMKIPATRTKSASTSPVTMRRRWMLRALQAGRQTAHLLAP